MKKTNITLLLCAALAICGCKSKTVSYETTSFDSSKISINESNISYQEPEENVLETTKIPRRLDTAAPGRDYVYLENENYYFVEDVVRGLLTIARKEAGTESMFIGNNFMFTYRTGSFTATKEGDEVKLSYNKEGINAPGSNYATFKLVKDTDCESLTLANVAKNGGEEDNIMISDLYGVPGTTFVYLSANQSEEDGLTVVNYQYAAPCGNDVVFIDVIRTICDDDDIDMPIEADFENLFQSFLVLI